MGQPKISSGESKWHPLLTILTKWRNTSAHSPENRTILSVGTLCEKEDMKEQLRAFSKPKPRAA